MFLKHCWTFKSQNSIGSSAVRTRMPDTKPSSIKSRTVWSTPIKASRTFNCLISLFSLLAIRSIWLSSLHPLALTLISFAIIAAAIAIIIDNAKPRLVSCDDQQKWHIKQGQKRFKGNLSSGCFQSSHLLVLALRPESGLTQHIMIWRDAVSPEQFSALQITLADYTRRLRH